LKKKDLEYELKKLGWTLISDKGKHEKWGNGKGMTEPVPRHNEIDEYTAKAILKRAKQNPG
jgi:predicted RNA binding protein YcfA (HicA-like mRNA interferase family)